MVWNKDEFRIQCYVPSPSDYRWVMEDKEWVLVMVDLAPAIIQLVKCKCAKKRCSTNRCQCRKAGVLCTDLFISSDDGDFENQQVDLHQNDEEEEKEEDELDESELE